jgi:hypothetical protein
MKPARLCFSCWHGLAAHASEKTIDSNFYTPAVQSKPLATTRHKHKAATVELRLLVAAIW